MDHGKPDQRIDVPLGAGGVHGRRTWRNSEVKMTEPIGLDTYDSRSIYDADDQSAAGL